MSVEAVVEGVGIAARITLLMLWPPWLYLLIVINSIIVLQILEDRYTIEIIIFDRMQSLEKRGVLPSGSKGIDANGDRSIGLFSLVVHVNVV